MPSNNRKKLRNLLAKLDPSKEAKLLADNLSEDIKAIENRIPISKDYSESIEDIKNELGSLRENILNKLENLPDKSNLDELKKKYLEKISVVEKNINSLLSSLEVNLEITDENVNKLRKDTEKSVKELRELLNHASEHGGGSANQRIKVNGTVMSKKYADVNLKGSITAADNNTNKEVDITFASPSIGGTISGGTEGSVLFVGPGSTFAQDNTNFFWNDSTNQLTIRGNVVTEIIQDTQANILALTPTIGLQAYATDLQQFYIANGSSWLVNSSYFDTDLQAPDMGWLQTSNREGYGRSYVTDKTIANSRLGDNANTDAGGVRYNATGNNSGPTLQTYYSSTWNNIVAGFSFRESTTSKALQHNPVGSSYWMSVFSGDSEETLGLNGLPIVQGYKVSMGCYPCQQILNGGSF